MSDQHNASRDVRGKNMGTSSIQPIRFTHRENGDGTVDSICGSCFLVVARAFEEADLERLERRHECQPFERRKSIRIVHRIYTYQSMAGCFPPYTR